ncbi:MAG TPA: hypothetical protein PLX18_12580, partial [Anaerohalosphaeraceae bacterium]|nr:hypothetical protein [Anaerohalosphaeraceae bacterium]HQI08680.1 hypothetical protein [Anaerohalosphaeraceae bacterium]HQJ69026.1 hypothetical protein [Anaerohalosphaeraceae bacterium]
LPRNRHLFQPSTMKGTPSRNRHLFQPSTMKGTPSEYELSDLVFVDEDILREAIRMVEEQWGLTNYDLLGTEGAKYNCQDFVKWVKMYYIRLGGRIYRNGIRVN